MDSDVEEEGGDECDETSDIAGMGLTTLCELEYDDAARIEAAAAIDDDHDDEGRNDEGKGGGGGGGEHDENDIQQRAFRERRRRRANEALVTLLSLISSEDMPRGGPRHFFRLDSRRFALAGHTSRSISYNHARVVDLLGRCGGGGGRRRAGVVGDDAVGLALDAAGIAFVMRNFPSLCAYDADEVAELVTFLLRPLPETGSFPSVAMVADGGRFGGGDGADVDCEFCLRGCCPRLVSLDVRLHRIDPFAYNISLSCVFSSFFTL